MSGEPGIDGCFILEMIIYLHLIALRRRRLLSVQEQRLSMSVCTFTTMGVSGDQGFVHQRALSCAEIHGRTYHHVLPAEMQGPVCWCFHDPQLRRGNLSTSRSAAHGSHPADPGRDKSSGACQQYFCMWSGKRSREKLISSYIV